MTTADSSLQGFAPELAIQPGNPEAVKYGRLWTEFPQYRAIAPGEHLAQEFLAQARPQPGASVIDFGCGTGRGALMLAVLGQMNVTMIDFVRPCLDDEVRQACETQAHTLRFVKADLERPLPVAAEYGYCTDVMEHIPPDTVDAVLVNILRAAQHVYFSISTVDDVCGQLIGEPLHLSIHPYAWWLAKLQAHECVVHWSQEVSGAAQFYVTAWEPGSACVTKGTLNIAETQVRTNVEHNTGQGWRQVTPHSTNDVEVMILGGGPSLSAYEDEIREKRAAGVKCVTLNGAYKWALDRGLGPVTQIMVDARAFNARFVEPVDPANLYLIASQCDPVVLAGLPRDRTLLWHTSTEIITDLLKAAYPDGWWSIPGGSTVLLRAIPLLRMLGFRRFHLYGCDSCLGDEEAHHAYAQPENDASIVLPVTLGGRMFHCHWWMASQTTEFLDLIRFMGDEIELEVHGDGLLAWALEYAAQAGDAMPALEIADGGDKWADH